MDQLLLPLAPPVDARPPRARRDKAAPKFEPGSIAERFARFDAEHPEVYKLYRKLAMDLRLAGHARFSSDAILHRIRWEHAVRGPREGFKLNDHFSACYARKLAAEQPAFRGFFEFRKAKGDAPR